MMSQQTFISPFSLCLLGIVFFCCNSGTKNNTEIKDVDPVIVDADPVFIYEFGDASVPPAYHRSYTIRVTPNQVYLDVYAYGDTLLKDSATLLRASYESFANSISKLNIKKKKEVEPEGCTGGTTDNLDLFAGMQKQIKGYIYYCGGEQYGDLEGDIEVCVRLFKNLAPDLTKKIDATRK